MRIADMIHQPAYEVYAESADGAVFDGCGEVGVVAAERRERPTVIEQFDRHLSVIKA